MNEEKRTVTDREEGAIPKEQWCAGCWLYEDRHLIGNHLDGVWDFKLCRSSCWKDVDIED